jgi:hypothetical protein
MSEIILADAADAADLNAETTVDGMSRAARRTLDRQAAKEAERFARSGNKAVTRRELPAAVIKVLESTVGHDIAGIYQSIAETAIETTAIIAVLAEKGILTQEEVDGQTTKIKENMQRLHEAAVNAARTQEQAPVNAQSPALLEATQHANGAQVQRLDESRPSGLIVVGR